MKENNEKKMKYCDEISKLIKAFPKDIAALRNENEIEGDKDMKEVDNGGYNVHPVPLPNSEIKERIRKRYEDW